MPAVLECRHCEARSDRPSDNLHCVADLSPHAWHTCGDIQGSAPWSDCPNADHAAQDRTEEVAK